MDIDIKLTKAEIGSIEHYRHYSNELIRLNALLPLVPIKDRSTLAFNIDGVVMIIEEYEELS